MSATPSESPLVHLIRPPRRPQEGRQAAIILLHGRGADEVDLFGLADALDPRLLVISARAPLRLGPGYHWYELHEIGRPDGATFDAAVALLERFIADALDRYAIDPQRLHLLGFSQGAMMASALTLMHPVWIAGAILLSGYIPLNMEFPIDEEQLAGKPFFVAHGTQDAVVPLQLGRESETFLAAAGADLTYREYSIGHQISYDELQDMADWLSALLSDEEQS